MKIPATFHRLATDKEGESTVSFKVPQESLPDALALATLTERLLYIEITDGETT